MAAPAKKTVSLFYDVISPYSWIAFEALTRYRTEWSSMDLKLKPTFLGGIMKATGNMPPMVLPAKRAYMAQDMRMLREYYKIPIHQIANPEEALIRKGSLPAMRFLTALSTVGSGADVENASRQLWLRLWSRDEDILEIDNIKKAAIDGGVDENLVNKAISQVGDSEIKNKLMSITQEALDCGVFGLPAMVIGDPKGKYDMLFGSDRIHILADILGEKFVGPLREKSSL